MHVRETIIHAIEQRLRLRVTCEGKELVVDPYLLYEGLSGNQILHAWQISGQTDNAPPDSRNMLLREISSASVDGPYGEPHPSYNPSEDFFHRILVATPKP